MSLFEIISQSKNWSWSTMALAAAICLFVYVYLQWSQMPAGPIGLPYLGYYPFLSEEYYLELLEMTKKYGKVFCFSVTGQLYAHIPDLKSLREVAITKSHCFDKKPMKFTLFQDILGDGVLFANGEEWKTLRKFFIMKLKEFGVGEKSQESIVQDCLKEIVSLLNKSDGNVFEALDLVIGICNNVFLHLIFGNAKLNESDIQQFNEAYFSITKFNLTKRVLLSGPILKYILIPFLPEYRNYQKNKTQVNAIMGKFVRQLEMEFDPSNIESLVDAYINEGKLLLKNKDPRANFFTEHCLVSSLLQFLGDGTLGVSYLTAIILNTLSSYRDVQKEIQSEIDEVVGQNRLPSLDDKSKLSYTCAAIYEGMRVHKLLPLLPSVECTRETTVGGCRIPKGTIVLYNMWGALHDAELYDEPNKFDPTRFLSVDGKTPRCEMPFLFGVGKRSCTSEPLVFMQVLLYIATVLQHFDLHPVEPKSQTEEWNFFMKATPRVP